MKRLTAICLSIALTAGCATISLPPYVGQGPHPQIERGRRCLPIDILGNMLALPSKLILWDWKFANHYISPETEEVLVGYLSARDLPAFKDARFQLNEYRPLNDLSRLIKNRYAAWPYRLLLGLPMTLIMEVLLPGRLFPWGDYYNPLTNTVHLYSDHPAVALHETGHVYDFSTRKYKGTYSLLRIIPFVDLYQEYKATHYALEYLKETRDRKRELDAYKILYPAYGTYVGHYLIFPLNYIPIIIGHIWGRGKAHDEAVKYRKQEEENARKQPAKEHTPPTLPVSGSTGVPAVQPEPSSAPATEPAPEEPAVVR